MTKLAHLLFVRHRHNWLLFIRFGLVGASGFLVNLLVFIGQTRLIRSFGINEHDVFIPLFGTDFSIRYLLVMSTISFLVANLWNFQLNRTWTFKSSKHRAWWKEYLPFVAVGAIAQFIGLGILVLLTNPTSPLNLPDDIFDNSSGFRTKAYWAQMIMIVITTPLNFIINKLWTFSAVRGGKQEAPMVGAVVAPEVIDDDEAHLGEPAPEQDESDSAAGRSRSSEDG
ncbi:GtrA family protein [Parenemella sanctibonifatiensis]|uniref:Polysaccharide synthesis protein GtrA n=1 Tax=Parenemella sanctibonifatiensis TaxID=2016505 RepID=A0A255E9F5_9ACTN|nr:GtrA family protein [Parenemella sanctibonifatiensis]OYN88199.1 polysaccharide synthesis protein GtrA [Parenemella sanctibonifatiensis]